MDSINFLSKHVVQQKREILPNGKTKVVMLTKDLCPWLHSRPWENKDKLLFAVMDVSES